MEHSTVAIEGVPARRVHPLPPRRQFQMVGMIRPQQGSQRTMVLMKCSETYFSEIIHIVTCFFEADLCMLYLDVPEVLAQS